MRRISKIKLHTGINLVSVETDSTTIRRYLQRFLAYPLLGLTCLIPTAYLGTLSCVQDFTVWYIDFVLYHGDPERISTSLPKNSNDQFPISPW